MSDNHLEPTSNDKSPKPVVYKIQIDKTVYETSNPTPTGNQLLELAGKLPVKQFALYLKKPGSQPVRIGANENVNLAEPGTEKFITLPLDQTEGLGSRRQFALPNEDAQWLQQTGLQFELVAEAGALRVIVYDFPVPAGYNVRTVAVNVRIDSGYPDTQIDMAYFYPRLSRLDGRLIGALCDDSFDGKIWQRWSRHRTPANPWRPGIDNLSTHFALVESWFTRELTKA